MAVARPSENAIAAFLGVVLVGGVYADGWARLNLGDLGTFFTPWHSVLYGGFGLLVALMAVMVWRRRTLRTRWLERIPRGYGWGWAGVGVFALGGVGHLLWHLRFNVQSGIDPIFSPTQLLQLVGGVLLLTCPLRAAVTTNLPKHRWPAVVSLGSATSLAGFFLGYVAVFVNSGASEPLATIPEGLPGHRSAELPAIAGLAGYLVSTVLLVVPVFYLRRQHLLAYGSITVLVGAVAIPAATLSQPVFLIPAAAALAGASVVDLILSIQPQLPDAALAGVMPALLWTGQFLGLASTGNLRWPPELWISVVVLTALTAATLTLLMAPGPTAVTGGDSSSSSERWTQDLLPTTDAEHRAADD